MSPDFIEELYRYSGGIPDLVQAYGTGAWKSAIKRNAAQIQLTGADIHPYGRIHHTLIDSKATAAKKSFLGDLSAKLGAAETATLKEIGRAEHKAPAQQSLEQWIAFSHARLTKAEWNRDAAKRALDILVDCGIIILDGTKSASSSGQRYSFRSEGIRLSFAR